ncbi:helix-turn-helix domain-containing protein [Oceanobacillus arenosus]|nr:helix-turn-helix domain-containing protein [Oceanobacillus arenosus]
MAKYSEEFKMKIVTEYLQGNFGYVSLAKKYNISSTNRIYEWVRAYKSQGMDGLKRRKTKKDEEGVFCSI